jgi:hypothetical protein
MIRYKTIEEQLKYLQLCCERDGYNVPFDAVEIISNIKASIFLVIKQNCYYRVQQHKNKMRCIHWKYCCDDEMACPLNNPEKSCVFLREYNSQLMLDDLRRLVEERVWVQYPTIGEYGLVAYHSNLDGDDVYITNNLGERKTYERINLQGGSVYRHKLNN